MQEIFGNNSIRGGFYKPILDDWNNLLRVRNNSWPCMFQLSNTCMMMASKMDRLCVFLRATETSDIFYIKFLCKHILLCSVDILLFLCNVTAWHFVGDFKGRHWPSLIIFNCKIFRASSKKNACL